MRQIVSTPQSAVKLWAKPLRTVLLVCIAGASMQQVTNGQGLTGQISGRIQDPSDKLVIGADVVLTSADTGQRRSAKTNSGGEFVFLEVLPGSFDLRVEAAGFKTFEKNGIALSSGQHLVLSSITLALGQVTETVLVEADAAPLETQSSDRSGLVDSRQMQQLALDRKSTRLNSSHT